MPLMILMNKMLIFLINETPTWKSSNIFVQNTDEIKTKMTDNPSTMDVMQDRTETT